jgi:predicted porin
MKKTLVALAVLATAGSAHAGIQLFNQDKVTVTMDGDVEVYYVKAKKSGSEFQQEIGDADFGFDTRYAVNDDIQVGAYWAFDGANDGKAEKNLGVGDVYIGLYSNSAGSIKFGKLNTQLDDIGIGSDYNFGITKFVNDADVGGEEGVRYDLDKGTFYAGLGYLQNKKGINTGLGGEDGNLFDAKLGARFADVDARVFVGQATIDKGAAPDDKEQLIALEATWTGVENLTLEAAYYTVKNDFGAAGKSDETDNTFAFAAGYDFQVVAVNAGLSHTKFDEKQPHDSDGYDSRTDWFLNVGYPFAPGVTAYAEVGADNAYSNVGTTASPEYKKNGTGFGVGIQAAW